MFRERGFLFLLLTRSELRARRLPAGVREQLRPEDRAVIAHRYTTELRVRPYAVGLGEEEFAMREDFGCFACDWEARGQRHAIGVEIDRWLDGGLNVLLHAQRQALGPARRRYGAALRVVCAPVPSGATDWGQLVASWRGRAGQLPLALELDAEPIDAAAEAALLLDESLAPATRQLGEALRQQTPPLGGEEARPTPGEVHVLV